jgi:beta-galactosidase
MPRQKLSRRTFLQSATAVTLAAKLNSSPAQSTAQTAAPYPENGTLIPDDDWRLWIDEKAEWKNDPLFLPEDITTDAEGVLHGKGTPLPVNEPTGGWGSLRANNGINVTLPTTVEQHQWGKFGAGENKAPRPYTPEEYRYAADDPIPQNGAYLGVSWWGRELHIPAEWKGKRIFLHIRGARLRAEVFLNKKLVGYSIMEELPFECDLSYAADPGGLNLLGIRLTNPFGRYDWVDGLNAQWGAVKLYRSHGFAGLDRGMTLSAHSREVRITDAWILNTAQSDTVQLFANVSFGYEAGHITDELATGIEEHFKVELQDGNGRSSKATISRVKIVEGVDFDLRLTCTITKTDAMLWNLGSPHLYLAKITQLHPNNVDIDTRPIAFGFRSFAPPA